MKLKPQLLRIIVLGFGFGNISATSITNYITYKTYKYLINQVSIKVKISCLSKYYACM